MAASLQREDGVARLETLRVCPGHRFARGLLEELAQHHRDDWQGSQISAAGSAVDVDSFGQGRKGKSGGQRRHAAVRNDRTEYPTRVHNAWAARGTECDSSARVVPRTTPWTALAYREGAAVQARCNSSAARGNVLCSWSYHPSPAGHLSTTHEVQRRSVSARRGLRRHLHRLLSLLALGEAGGVMEYVCGEAGWA